MVKRKRNAAAQPNEPDTVRKKLAAGQTKVVDSDEESAGEMADKGKGRETGELDSRGGWGRGGGLGLSSFLLLSDSG